MKPKKILMILLLNTCLFAPTIINAKDSRGNGEFETVVEIQSSEDNFIELGREEFITQIAQNENLSFAEAEKQVIAKDMAGMIDTAARGEIMSRGLQLKYGYFTGIFYTPTDTNRMPLFSTCATYGVYASYYLPDVSSPWSARKFNAIQSTLLYANNNYSAVEVFSKNANITSSYNINFAASFKMKRDLPYHVWVNYTISKGLGL